VVFLVALSWTVTFAAQGRTTLDLMGEWALWPVEGTNFGAPPLPPVELPADPAAEGWRAVTFPGGWNDGRHTGAWLVKSVVLKGDPSGRTALLRFDSVGFAVRAYVNGEDCGFAHSGYAPVEFDVTRALKTGTNLIQLAVTTAALYPEMIDHTGMEYFQAAILGQNRKTVSLWQRAELTLVPPVYLADLFVKPDTANRRLVVDAEVVNATDAPASMELTAAVFETNGTKKVLALPPATVRLAARERRVVTLSAPWKNPRLWWPHDPHLYALKAELSAKSDKSDRSDKSARSDLSDSLSARFGFRDIAIRGIDLLLNGKKLLMRGVSWTRYTSVHTSKEQAREVIDRFIRDCQVNALRLHVDSMEQYVLDAADEAGVLLLVQAPIAAGGGGIGDPAVWAILDDMHLRYVKLSRNHPSVAIWSVANEAGGMRPWNPTPASPFLAERIRKTKALDPTRPATEAHDFTMLGASDLMDLPTQWQFCQANTFPLNCRLWFNTGYELSEYKFDRPMVNDEWGEGNSPSGAAFWFGDKAYIHPDRGGDVRSYWVRFSQSVDCYMNMVEQRRQPYWCVSMPFGDRFGFWKMPFGHYGEYTYDPSMVEFAHRTFAPAIVAPKDWNGGAWAGEEYLRPLILMNDHFYDLACILRWSVTDAGGRELIGGRRKFKIPAVTHQDFDLRFTMPPSDRPAEWKLNLELTDAKGRRLFWDSHELGVLPRPNMTALKPVVLWPEAGTLGALPADRLGLKHAVSDRLPDTATVVIVPRGAKVRPSQWRALDAWIRSGGAALVLADNGLPNALAGTELRSSGHPAVIGHIRAPDHPVVAGLPQPALRYWLGAAGEFDSIPYRKKMPHLYISTMALRRPRAGHSLTLLDGAAYDYLGTSGLIQALLSEIRSGQGRALLCSLLLAEAMGSDLGTGRPSEPAALWLLHRCLHYLQNRASWLGEAPKPLMPIGADLSRWRFETTDRPAEACAILINAASEEGRNYLAGDAWLQYARSGGKVILHNLDTNQVREVGERLGVPLEAEPMQRHRLDLREYDPILRGISHYDINWIEAGGLCLVSAMQPIMAVAVTATNGPARNLTVQGGIVLVPVGQGQVLIDQVLWDGPMATPEIAARATQYVSQLLSNHGAAGNTPIQNIADDAPMADENTIVLYHFEDEAFLPRLLDSGPRSADLTASGDVRLEPGRFHNALRLGGGTSTAKTWAYGIQTPELTYDFWIKPEGDPAKSCGIIMTTYRGANRADNSLVLTPQGRIGLSVGGGRIESKGTVRPDIWTRVTVTLSAANKRIRFYFDGQLDAQYEGVMHYPYGVLAFGNPFTAGTDDTLWGLAAFTGLVDEFRMVSVEWKPGE
jgi:hypothetical protein